MKKEQRPLKGIGELPPPRTPEERQDNMINLAMSLVEQRLRDGTATSQETVHFLKLATEREQLEQLKLEQEVELAKAKIESLKTAEETKKLYEEAIIAFRSYQGHEEPEDEDIF